MSEADTGAEPPTGGRERKRQETHDRIAEAGLKLFVENGFEATTLDAIAAAAGISRRTFFYYFKSKEDVLLAQDGGGLPEAMRAAMLEQSPDQTPLAAARDCLFKLASRYETKEAITISRLLRSTAALRARKDAFYVEIERTMWDAMNDLWPSPQQREANRVAAMVAIGTLRLAQDQWRQEDAGRPLAVYLHHMFSLLQSQF